VPPVPSLYTDKDLFLLISQSDEPAFRILFERYRSKLLLFLLKIVRSQPIAEELVQEVFVRIWISRHALDRVEIPDSYLFIIARNRALDHISGVVKERSLFVSAGDSFDEVDNSTEERILFRESKRLIDEAIGQLPAQQKKVYLLARQEGRSREEIAVDLHISIHTVKNHLVAATRSIRDYLSDHHDLALVLFVAGIYAG